MEAPQRKIFWYIKTLLFCTTSSTYGNIEHPLNSFRCKNEYQLTGGRGVRSSHQDFPCYLTYSNKCFSLQPYFRTHYIHNFYCLTCQSSQDLSFTFVQIKEIKIGFWKNFCHFFSFSLFTRNCILVFCTFLFMFILHFVHCTNFRGDSTLNIDTKINIMPDSF